MDKAQVYDALLDRREDGFRVSYTADEVDNWLIMFGESEEQVASEFRRLCSDNRGIEIRAISKVS